MKLRKLAIIISATALVFALTACGENKNQDADKGTSTPTASSDSETESTTVSEPESNVTENVESETETESESLSNTTTEEDESISEETEAEAEADTDTDTETNVNTETTENRTSGLYEENGVVLNDVGIELLGDTPNLMLKFENTSDKEEEFDFSKFEIKTEDGTVFKIMDGARTFKAKQPYSQHAVTFKDDGKLQVGDLVEIYYDGQLVDSITVEEF